MIKEIIFFSFGDSNNISTWSNVPYMFSKELERRGIVIRRINIAPNPRIRYRYNSTIYNLYCKIWPKNIYHYERSWLFYLITNQKIKKAVKQYNTADLCIFCTFSFYNRYNSIPSLLLCDWSFEILIKERLNRNPFFIEKEYIKRENTAINNAHYVISLFQECAKTIKEENPKANIHFLGNNVVNSAYKGEIDEDKIIIEKSKKRHLLFIGNQNNPTYLNTAQRISEAFFIVKKILPDIELHIIGIEPAKLGFKDNNIYCYGYLHKDDKEECDLYYKILINSSLIINTTPLWAGYSSLIEAMYFYTPVLVAPFQDFVAEFGKNINFGRYCSTNNKEDIAKGIEIILTSNNYKQIAMNAHMVTHNYTWENYVNRVFKLID